MAQVNSISVKGATKEPTPLVNQQLLEQGLLDPELVEFLKARGYAVEYGRKWVAGEYTPDGIRRGWEVHEQDKNAPVEVELSSTGEPVIANEFDPALNVQQKARYRTRAPIETKSAFATPKDAAPGKQWLSLQVTSEKTIAHGFEESDFGTQLKTAEDLVAIAQKRWPGQAIEIEGTPQFQQAVWVAAQKAGLEVANYKPADETEEAEVLERWSAPQPSPEEKEDTNTKRMPEKVEKEGVNPQKVNKNPVNPEKVTKEPKELKKAVREPLEALISGLLEVEDAPRPTTDPLRTTPKNLPPTPPDHGKPTTNVNVPRSERRPYEAKKVDDPGRPTTNPISRSNPTVPQMPPMTELGTPLTAPGNRTPVVKYEGLQKETKSRHPRRAYKKDRSGEQYNVLPQPQQPAEKKVPEKRVEKPVEKKPVETKAVQKKSPGRRVPNQTQKMRAKAENTRKIYQGTGRPYKVPTPRMP
jgi:hypothetical protein